MSKENELIEMYTEAGYRLLELIKTLEDGPTKMRKQKLLKQVQQIISTLSDDAAKLAKEIVEESYQEGSNEAVKQLVEQGLKRDEVVTPINSIIHKEAVQEIVVKCFIESLNVMTI
jgi:F0F1-type ATP synthase membrane subunit b/b'